MPTRNLDVAVFQMDVAHHELVVLRDDGLYRHLRFRRPGTLSMHFDILTWPGYLCYTGDMGTYVFQRVEDMLRFFRRTTNPAHTLFDGIDMRYWAEKVQADDRTDGVTEFDPQSFKDAVKQRFDEFIESREDWSTERRDALWNEVSERIIDVLDDHDPHLAFEAVYEFDQDGLRFEDFFECNLDAFSYRFQWCCFALRWGIDRYDTATAAAKESSDVAA